MLKWLRSALAGNAAFVVVGNGALADAVADGAKTSGYAVTRKRSLETGQAAKAIAIASGDQAADLETVRAYVAGWTPKPGSPAAETVLAVVCETQKGLTALQDMDSQSPAGLRVRSLSASAHTARSLLLAHSFAKLQRDDAQPVIVGTGPEAEQIIVQLFRTMHRPGVTPRVTVVGPDAQAWLDRLVHDVPGLLAAGAPKASTTLGTASAIYVADSKVWASLASSEWFVPVYWLPGAGGRTPVGAIAVAAMDWNAAVAGLFNDPADAQAQAIHQLYFEERKQSGDIIGSRPSMQPWEDLPERFRAASRHQADHIATKLAAIDCHAVAAVPEVRFAFTPDELEALAEIEHRRWAAVQLLDGWQYGETRDDRAKRTPGLVPYDALTQEVKDLDRLSVRAVQAQLDKAHRSILRDLRIGFDVAGEAAPGFSRGFAQLLDDIAKRYADRVPVVVTRLATPLQCAAAMVVLECGKARLSVVLDPLAEISSDAKELTAKAETICLSGNGLARLDIRVVGHGDQTAEAGGARIVEIDETGAMRRAPWH